MTRLKQGGEINDEERAKLRSIVSSGQGDLHNASRALAWGSPRNDSDCRLLLNLLGTTGDDWAAQGAIYALFSYWRVDASHLRALDRFLGQEAWSEWPSAAIAGIGALGDYAFRSDEVRYLARLVQIAEEGGEVRRECALSALECAVYGREGVRNRVLRGNDPDFDASLLQRARARLA